MRLHPNALHSQGRGLLAGMSAALVLIASLVLFPTAAFAGAVSSVSFTPGNTAAGATSTWTVGFTATSALSGKGSTITMAFNSAFGIGGVSSSTVTLGSSFNSNGNKCNVSAVSAPDVTVTLGGGNNCTIAAGTALTLSVGSVVNATTAGSYPGNTFTVKTSGDATPTGAGSAVVIAAAAASKLAFVQQPTTATAGAAITPAVTVQVQDANGNLVSTSASITVAIGTNAGGGTLSGTTTVNSANGVATFNDLSINRAGTGYTLTASSGTLTAATSNTFTINAASASKLAFVQQPTDAFAGTGMSPAVTVQVQDQYGNAVSQSGVSITLTPSAGSVSAGATASTSASGLATFSGMTFNSTAPGITLSASGGGYSSAPSAAFNVTVKVTSASAALTDTASDAGAGVKSVSYYYCSGYSGACTNGTLIGSSSNASGSFPVTWAGQPANGAYRVIAVGTDNVGNVGSASVSTPVTVSN